ncbi:MAG TPA: peptidase M28, partial [Gammaproteobacteria bacterium]|nr:peptidase M28 [Gammaproteobacteria bacterium]
MRATVSTFIAALLVGCGAEPAGTGADAPESGALFSPAELGAAERITAETIRPVIAEIASDGYAGRGPGTEGDRAARAYLATRLADAGFEPAGDAGGWEQAFELVGITAALPATWTFRREATDLELASGTEFMAFSGVQADGASIADADIVFVGYGIEAPEYGWDDFKGTDLTGKVLLMLNNDPDWDPALFAGETRLYYGRWSYKYESAARQGAAGAIIIHTTPSAGYPWQVVRNSWSGPQFELPAGSEP